MLKKFIFSSVLAVSFITFYPHAHAQDGFNPRVKPSADGAYLSQKEMRLRKLKASQAMGVQAQSPQSSEAGASVINTNHPQRTPHGNLGSPKPVTPQPAHNFVRIIYSFPTVSNNATDSSYLDLQTRLSNIDEDLKIARPADFVNQTSACVGKSTACVIVPEKLQQKFQDNAQALPNHNSVGLIESVSQQRRGNSASRTGTYGTTTVSYTNPDPTYYSIPDNQYYPSGYYQFAGAWLPSSTANIISSSAMITNVSWSVNVYHTYHKDLIIDMGIDYTSVAGQDYTQARAVANRPTGIWPGFYTYHGSSSYFNGLHPDGYYYVQAYDVAAQDQGYVNYADFEVDWIDYSNLTFYGTNSSNYMVSNFANKTISAHNIIYNDSYVDIETPFAIGWYVEKDTSALGNCSALTYNPAGANTWAVSYANINYLPANTTLTANLSTTDLRTLSNTLGYGLGTGNYCLWAYVDDLDQVVEFDESYANNFYNLGGFYYQYESYLPDLTFNYAASNIAPTVDPVTGVMAASAVVKNNSSTTAVNATFETSWYLAKVPANWTDCSALSTFDINQAYFAGSRVLSNWAAGASQTVTLPGSIKISSTQNGLGQPITFGSYCMWAWVDDFNQVLESDETNNVLVYTKLLKYTDVVQGIKNNSSLAAELNLYPVPTAQTLNIDLPESTRNEELKISIMNSAGQVVMELSSEKQQQKMSVDVSNLPSGNYFLSIEAKEASATKQFIKL